MTNSNKSNASLPTPPPIKRTFQFHRLQKIGIPLIILLPVLALIGLFGESFQSAHAAGSQLVVDVHYPSRLRYKMTYPMSISVENASDQTLPFVQLYFDRAYIDSFSNTTFTPNVDTVTEEAYIVELTDLQPQEVRAVSVELQAEQYWQRVGTITAVSDNGESVSVSLNTLVFP